MVSLAKIVCVSPAFNEERTVSSIVRESLKHVDEVIVVDDGSTDATFKKALAAGAIVIRHPRNMGKGAALKTGFSLALKRNADIIVSIDADGQHEPNEIPKLLKKLMHGSFDLVVGSRFLGSIEGMPSLRILSNTITSRLLRLFFKLPITDSQSGYRAFKRKVIEVVTFSDPRFAAETEILIEAHRKGFKIGEVKIKTIYGEEKSKMRNVEDTIRWLKVLFKYLILSIVNKDNLKRYNLKR
ncbi:MAG: glycosyltransferase family 2 protein [Candidatus Freyarchaeota archaeon]